MNVHAEISSYSSDNRFRRSYIICPAELNILSDVTEVVLPLNYFLAIIYIIDNSDSFCSHHAIGSC